MAHIDRGASRLSDRLIRPRQRLRMAEDHRRTTLQFQKRTARLRAVSAQRPEKQAAGSFWRQDDAAPRLQFLRSPTGDPSQMKLYGFWRSLATYRVKVALG